MCYSWEDFETGCSPLYRPNGKDEELSFSRKKISKEESNQIVEPIVGWKAPRTLDKVERHVEQSHYDYIGAPGGEDWIIPNTWMVNKIDNVDDDGNLVNDIYVRPKQVINLNTWEVSKMDDVDYDTMEDTYHKLDEDVVNKCAFMYPPVVDENVRLYDGKLVNMKDYYVSGIFDAQAAIQDGVPTSVVIKHVLENKYQEQLTKEMQDYDTWLLNQMISKGDGRTGIGLYSKLYALNINKGQGDMFSYTNTAPAAGSKPSDDFKAFEKLTNKLVNKSKTYRPLPDCLTIKESSIDGLGLFAVEDIDKDVTLGVTHHYIDVGFKDELIRTPLAGFLNHSDNPNVTIEEFENGKGIGHTYKNYKLITLRPISLGEEIVVDYTKELCGLSGYDGAEFLEDKLEDMVYENKDGILYYYNSAYGKFESTYGTPNNNPIFYTPEDAEKFLKRVE